MIVGLERVDETAAKLLEGIAAGVDGDDLAEIDEVLVIAAVHFGAATDEPDAEVATLYYRCTSARWHVQLGLLEQARRAVDKSQMPLDEDEDDTS